MLDAFSTRPGRSFGPKVPAGSAFRIIENLPYIQEARTLYDHAFLEPAPTNLQEHRGYALRLPGSTSTTRFPHLKTARLRSWHTSYDLHRSFTAHSEHGKVSDQSRLDLEIRTSLIRTNDSSCSSLFSSSCEGLSTATWTSTTSGLPLHPT